MCEITFAFLQFRVHFNLKTDLENEAFYLRCKEYLSEQTNAFDRNLKKCFNVDSKFKEMPMPTDVFILKSSLVKMLSGFWFWVTVATLSVFLTPAFYIICVGLQ